MGPAGGRKGIRVNEKTELVVASFLMLFVELALIRWTGSNVVYLSYFSNFVLLGSFLGIGLGFLRGGTGRNLFLLAPWALAGLAVFVRGFQVSIDRQGSELIFFGSGAGQRALPTWLMLPVIFIVVAAILAFIAAGVARRFAKFPPLQAYALDIGGSIVGIAAFTVLSFLRAEPIVWGLIATAATLVLMTPRQQVLAAVPLLVLCVTLAVESRDPELSWSPYYKVRTIPQAFGLDIHVNGIPHQALQSTALRRQNEPIYFVPYAQVRNNPLENVLIVGAGNGTDVAIALANGAKHVDAVEIDPRLHEIGRASHPDRPYDDPRVDVHIDDGRAFLERAPTKYDLILFALPDSLTLVSGQSSLRLESFLFTEEALSAARERLKPNGTFAMYNFYRERWLVDRLGATLTEVFGREPCLSLSPQAAQLAMMSVGNSPSAVSCQGTWTAATFPVPAPATDDYPFLYLKERGIPSFYLIAILAILGVSILATRVAGGPFRTMRGYADLFFMGMAFLLLETKNVIQFALLFGTTWIVNAMVFLGILVSILIAVAIARRWPVRNPQRLYVLLLATIVVAYAVPNGALLAVPAAPRFLLAVLIAFSPIFVANLVFAERFATVENSTAAFGANLLGAMVGGVLEYVSLLTGYRFLLIVVAVLYGLAFLTGRRYLVPGGRRGQAAPARSAG